jgi:hypothetical protein
MRFSDYLAGLPPLTQLRLSNTVMVGCGRVQLAALLQEAEVPASTLLGTLTAAYASLATVLADVSLTLAATGLSPPDGPVAAHDAPGGAVAGVPQAVALARTLRHAIDCDHDLTVVGTHLVTLLRIVAQVRDGIAVT